MKSGTVVGYGKVNLVRNKPSCVGSSPTLLLIRL